MDAQLFEPDEAIIFVSQSSLSRKSTGYIYSKYIPRFKTDPDGNLRLIPVPNSKNVIKRLAYKLLSPMYLPYFVDRTITQFRASLKTNDKGEGASKHTLGNLERAVLRKAKQIALDNNQKLSVFVNLRKELSDELREFYRLEGISFYETSAKGKEYQLGEHDPHWNAQENKLIAQDISSQMAIP